MLVVYSKNNCPECNKAVQFLTEEGIPYSVVKVDQDPAAYSFLISKGHKSVPQLYKNGEVVVSNGYKGLLKLSDEELAALK